MEHSSLKKNELPTKQTLLRSSMVIYTAMTVVGFEICWWYHLNIGKLFAVGDADWFLFLRISLISIAFLTLGQHLLEDLFPSYRRLKMTFAKIFKGLNVGQVLLLALLSSVGEEMLFRGAIQPFLGVWFTSVIFALLHFDPEGKSSIWSVWAFIGGVIMGMAVEVTGSLWPALMIHFGVNAISIHRVSRLAAKVSATADGKLGLQRKGH